MNIRSLSIKNYRSIKELDIEKWPEQALIGIVGHNGAGKSSLLESIGWALYGTQAIRGKKEGITTRGAKGKCKVIMDFDHGDDGPYTIERTLEKAILKRGGEVSGLEMTSAVNEMVENILNMNYRAFENSIFTKQGGLGSFTKETSGNRRKIIEKLLDVTKVEEARGKIGSEARDLYNHLHTKREFIQDEDNILEEITGKKQELSQLKEIENELKNKKMKSEEMKLKADEKLKNIQKKQNLFVDAEKHFIGVEHKLNNYGTELRIVKSSTSEKKNEIEKAKKRTDELNDIIITHDVTKELDNKLEKSDKIVKKIEKYSKTLNKMEAIIEDKQKHIEEIEKLGHNSKCSVCLRPLGEHGPKVVNDLKKEIKNIKINEIREKLEKWNKKERKLKKEIIKLNDRIKVKGEAVVELKTFDVKKLEINYENMNKNLNNIKDKIKNQKKALKEAKTKMEKIEFDKNEYKYLNDKQDEALIEWQKSIEHLGEHKTKIATVSQDLKNKESRIQEITKVKSKIKDGERKLKLLRILEERLEGFRPYLTGRIAPVLQNRIGERLSQITQARYNSVTVDPKDYGIKVMDGTDLLPLEEFSGGEADAFNLAFRLSISDVITERLDSEIGMVVLDEVLGSQDEDRQKNILQGLESLARGTKARKGIGQILMVTHIDSIKNQLRPVWSVSLDVEKGTQISYFD